MVRAVSACRNSVGVIDIGLALGVRYIVEGSVRRFAIPEKTPQLVLATISASHFVEKVRWCMDRLGVDYVEQTSGGTLGAFFRGRTVPQLKARTGSVQSSIGNSAEILRYLWGRYAVDDPAAAAFLEPTTERIELEKRLDRHGVNLQVWIYYHLLNCGLRVPPSAGSASGVLPNPVGRPVDTRS